MPLGQTAFAADQHMEEPPFCTKYCAQNGWMRLINPFSANQSPADKLVGDPGWTGVQAAPGALEWHRTYSRGLLSPKQDFTVKRSHRLHLQRGLVAPARRELLQQGGNRCAAPGADGRKEPRCRPSGSSSNSHRTRRGGFSQALRILQLVASERSCNLRNAHLRAHCVKIRK